MPVYAHFGITHRCNLTCKMCGIWRYGNEKEELSLDECREIAARMRRLGVVQCSIGGGEPFAHQKVEEIAKFFVDEGINLRLLTNGIGVGRDRIDRAIDYGVKNFSISLDSLYPNRFDYICEYDGAWDEAVSTISHIGRRLAGVPGAMPTINCVVSNLNLEELPDMVRFAKDVGFAISFLPIELLPRREGWRPQLGSPLHSLPTRDGAPYRGQRTSMRARVDKAYDQIIRMKAEGWPILNSTPYLESSRTYRRPDSSQLKAAMPAVSTSPSRRMGSSPSATARCSSTFTSSTRTSKTISDSASTSVPACSRPGSCEGCMRACWIDTSHMFRTLQGFMETAKLTLKPTRTRGQP